jgi:hypothetical protein
MKAHKYRVVDGITLGERLFTNGDILWIENSKGFRQVFDSDKKFVCSISKSQFNNLNKSLELIGD